MSTVEGLTVKDANEFFEKFKQTDKASRDMLIRMLIEYQTTQKEGADSEPV